MNARLFTSQSRFLAGAIVVLVFFWGVAVRRVTGMAAQRQPTGASALPAWAPGSNPSDPVALAERCAGRDAHLDPVVEAITAALGVADDGAARAALDVVEGAVRAEAEVSPEDVPAQYRLALWLGVRAERESGRTRISVAGELHSQAQRVVDLDPDHAGANFLLGRLHAGVMRLNRVARFLATRLLGGSALKKASWDEAERRLKAAEMVDPCEPDYHYELARLYDDRRNREDAERELSHVQDLTTGHDGRWALVRSNADRLLAQWKGRKN